MPDWMQPKRTALTLKPVPLELRISWHYKSTLPQPKEYYDYINNEQPDLEDLFPNFDHKIKIGPEDDRSEFMDAIRLLFNLEPLNAQIFSLQLYLQESHGDGKQRFNVQRTNWAELQKALWSGKYDLGNSAFRMTVRKANEGECIWDIEV